MFQNCFTDEDREKIYRKAQENCFKRQKKGTKSSPGSSGSDEMREYDGEGDSMSGDGQRAGSGESLTMADCEDEIRQIVPEAKDIREALQNFKEASGRIYFSLLDNKSYAKDTTFQQILEENVDKFKSIGMVLECFRYYKAATNMTLVPLETAQAVRNRIATLISEANDKMEELLRDPAPTGDPDTI